MDDPVGAIGVHCFCGAAGTVLVGVLDMNKGIVSGFIYNDALTASEAFKYFGVQLLGVVVVVLWVGITMSVVFTVMKKIRLLRASEADELAGLDLSEHGLESSYADFMPVPSVLLSKDGAPVPVTPYPENEVPEEVALPVRTVSEEGSGKHVFTKVTVVTRPDKFDKLKVALDAIGITGMTLTQVKGCGMQKGAVNYYRGAKVDVQLLPKIKLEMVVTAIPVRTVVDTVKKALYTGNYGDGKIFIYKVDNVIKVRTGEEGYDALQD